ncbi:MAG: pyruvate, phosphate dikinase [Spirochaetales bacterium]|nr:pyruvate, phosphate dikinase [Spirochaetales bacterium]
MKNNIHFFCKEEFIRNSSILEKIGLRIREANNFAELNLPVIPGFAIDSDVASSIENGQIIKYIKPFISKVENKMGKKYNAETKPLTLKIVISPNLIITSSYPALHNFGLTKKTLQGFSKMVGNEFSNNELFFMVKGLLIIEDKILKIEGKEKESAKINSIVDFINGKINKSVNEKDLEKLYELVKGILPDSFFEDAYEQLDYAISRVSYLLKIDEMNDNDTAIGVSAMVYGNTGNTSCSGSFYTRNIINGDKVLFGEYFQNTFDFTGVKGKDITKIDKSNFAKLDKIARTVEDHFKDIRHIRFTIENSKLWLVDQRDVLNKSVKSEIITLLDLHERKLVDDKYFLNAIKPEQLNEILHPIIDITSTKGFKKLVGGITGAPGAAIGRIFFTTEALLDANKVAMQQGLDTNFILCMKATFAEDVKAIEIATGVLSSEGGYAAHASVVARQYGKVSLVKPEMKFKGNKITIDDVTLTEGDYVTLNVPHYGSPEIYIGKSTLIEPDFASSGIEKLIQIAKKYNKEFHVRVNADNPRDCSLAKKFGAEGVGLCRTEHMFFNEKRINVFREMILSDNKEKRAKSLLRLKNMQKDDFYKILKIMEGKEVTIRLLDAPLHEFLPHNAKEMDDFLKYLKTQKGYQKITQKEIALLCDGLSEFNPMLGHRGCRIAISYPEIYEMQVTALFESVYSLQKEGVKVNPEIMIPIIMNTEELKTIVYGKKIEGTAIKGLTEVELQVRESLKAKPVEYKIGTMIELPAAALGAGDIARYAEFFSFGTNDLTQTTLGLSRDDFNNFMPDYTQFDIIPANPFEILDPNVQELVRTAVRRGKMTRPDIVMGLCGEQGAVPVNIEFCIGAGLNYVSCSTYSVPIATLAVAQYFIKE